MKAIELKRHETVSNIYIDNYMVYMRYDRKYM